MMMTELYDLYSGRVSTTVGPINESIPYALGQSWIFWSRRGRIPETSC